MNLNLPGRTHVAPADVLFDDLAISLASSAAEAVKERGVFHVALSGGSTPEPFYMHLCIDPRYRSISWEKTHFWIVDERRVPENHEKSNIKMIRESLTDHLPIKKRQVHPMPVLQADPATAYIEEMERVFESLAASKAGATLETGETIPRLDWVLLGMGDDAHTASLFPQSPALKERTRWIANNDGPHVTPPDRVTMTYPLLNATRELAVLCIGAKKLPTLKRVSEQLRKHGVDTEHFPITGIKPTDGRLTWYLDAAAAGE